ncbi:polysaccharide deacetylase family protein [Tenacibaculum sp. C7A-26P2]|uniref:polysaccharide deacetylase family protein n=1 Tax=Tenacibaculum sp. C7A-26P2 TaxID=3447504 RepID=UPI003F86D745
MRLYPLRTPYIFRKYFSKYIWCFKSSTQKAYLTFDDGPIPEVTEFVLDKLKKHNAKATFFCVGDNIQKHPSIFKKIIEGGHSIGNHTYNHLDGWKTKKKDYLNNILKTELLISNFNNVIQPKIFRPPYGKIKNSQTSALIKKGYKVIMWSLLSGDFDKNISKEECVSNILTKIKNGDIIVFHDSEKAKENIYYSLPIILKELSIRGYQFERII